MLTRKHIVSLLMLLMLALVVVGTVRVCQGGLTQPSQHKVEDAVDGTYQVYFYDSLIGHLTLSDGRYSFELQDEQEYTKLAAEKIYFGKYSNGSFEKEYYGSVDQNTLLEDLGEGDTFVHITFKDDGPGPDWSEGSTANFSAFVLTNNAIEKEVYLQFTYTVAAKWHIFKPWE